MKEQIHLGAAEPDKNPARPMSIEYADDELTPKDEAAITTLSPPDAQLAQVEEKLEHAAAVANRLPKTEQLAEFEKKLEHDDGGNQPS